MYHSDQENRKSSMECPQVPCYDQVCLSPPGSCQDQTTLNTTVRSADVTEGWIFRFVIITHATGRWPRSPGRSFCRFSPQVFFPWTCCPCCDDMAHAVPFSYRIVVLLRSINALKQRMIYCCWKRRTFAQ